MILERGCIATIKQRIISIVLFLILIWSIEGVTEIGVENVEE